MRWTSHHGRGRGPSTARSPRSGSPSMSLMCQRAMIFKGPRQTKPCVKTDGPTADAAPEPQTHLSKLGRRRARYGHPPGPALQTCRSFRSLLRIPCGRTGLTTEKRPPRHARPYPWRRHIARYGGLRNRQPELEKLAMDPRRAPHKIFTRHADYELTDFHGDPRAPSSVLRKNSDGCDHSL